MAQTATLSLAQALESVSDNITPDTQLVLGMRRVGAGFGFPQDGFGNPQDTVMFNCQNYENAMIELWAKDKAGNLENCTAQVIVYDTAGFCPFTLPPTICAHTYWNEAVVQGVAFSTSWNIPNQPPVVHPLDMKPGGCTELSPLPPTSLFTLQAFKDTVPLNGVTTYDLVLISKHILATEPFDAGWKIAAADANRSNSVTTFDIVELRKLILGLTEKLPNNTPSWRFFVDTCAVWGSPAYGYCPSEYTLPVLPISAYPANLSFKGLKVGDVNGSSASVDTLTSLAQERGANILLELPERELKAGETLELPLRAAASGEWTGWQFSLSFDPELLDIEAIVPDGILPVTPDHWAIPTPGKLNFSWSDAVPSTLLAGDALMHVRVKAHASTSLSEAIQMPGEGRVAPEAYDAAGLNHPVQLSFAARENSVERAQARIYAPLPNPTTGAARIPLHLPVTETVTVEISDLSGRRLGYSASLLEAGSHFVEIPASALAQTGVYVWRVCAGGVSESGRLVRI